MKYRCVVSDKQILVYDAAEKDPNEFLLSLDKESASDLIRVLGGMVEKRDGNWMDSWGACVCCDGEIPSGHQPNCDIHKLQMKVYDLEGIKARHVINHIKAICGKCGHTQTEDGCAFCIKEALKQLMNH
jgi:hypothetical protein